MRFSDDPAKRAVSTGASEAFHGDAMVPAALLMQIHAWGVSQAAAECACSRACQAAISCPALVGFGP